MALNIEKRVRALATDNWGAWTTTTDAPPYTDTALVQYKPAHASNITIDRLTAGAIEQNADGEYTWLGTGVFDELMRAVNGNIKVEYDNGRIVGNAYAEVYLGAIQSVIAQSVQFLLQEQATEAKTDVAVEQKNLLLKQQALVERQTRVQSTQVDW